MSQASGIRIDARKLSPEFPRFLSNQPQSPPQRNPKRAEEFRFLLIHAPRQAARGSAQRPGPVQTPKQTPNFHPDGPGPAPRSHRRGALGPARLLGLKRFDRNAGKRLPSDALRSRRAPPPHPGAALQSQGAGEPTPRGPRHYAPRRASSTPRAGTCRPLTPDPATPRARSSAPGRAGAGPSAFASPPREPIAARDARRGPIAARLGPAARGPAEPRAGLRGARGRPEAAG
ncbi:collagen alpha-1(I) chain-like [Talpa occidentalis]|uniref:collagen alpha-1(I) chain-like n=1 Tax=Talpa occidentalis TaxID=50954 RepID=UPI00188EFADD|nr:collagen alpha-1(I) chain-like [Talpa occidentalis]